MYTGTLFIKRHYTNTTSGAVVTRLKFRVIDMTTYPTPISGTADHWAISSTDASVANAVCGGWNITVGGTTLDQPAQFTGGGIGSTLSSGTITLATPLNPGQCINVQFFSAY